MAESGFRATLVFAEKPMNDGNESSGINVRSQHYLIARTAGICPHCHSKTCVVALMLPPGHEVLSMNEDDESTCGGSSIRGDTWESVPRHAFLFYVDSLPDQVRCRLQALAPMFRFAVSPTTQGSFWANHCAQCGAIQEDHDLFCEPEGAFLPVSPAAASSIELLLIQEALEVAAAGYAIDPQFIKFEAGS
jgi:hypothetical protein